ncbi:MAG: DUF11 domain-containing protein [Anaerolineae bacterium]|nr:DUF11 domain-containing protein [Anaerolineae bacterium]
MSWFLKRLITVVFLSFLIYANTGALVQAGNPSNFPNCRLGVGKPNFGDGVSLSGYNLQQLNLGQYSDWWVNDQAAINLPSGVKYIRTVRVHQDKLEQGPQGWWNSKSSYVSPPSYSVGPSLSTIKAQAAAYPGALWLIGNEIDRRDWCSGGTCGGQDEMTPELYATAFNEIRAEILSADPTAKIGIAGVIQATQLRLTYLDRVWDAYFDQYGIAMGEHIDVWSVHGFTLREVKGQLGASVPTGLKEGVDYEKEDGLLYGFSPSSATVVAAHHDINYFGQHLRDFRQWMADHGERNKPLINSEYGILYGSDFISSSQVNAFMNASFNFMLNTTDAQTGFPADENRLVQGWVWYSLTDDVNGHLFNRSNKTITTFGTNWKNYVSSAANPMASQAQYNVLPANLRTEPEFYNAPGSNVTFKLLADIANSGNTDSGGTINVSFWDGDPNSGGTQIGTTQTVNSALAGCGDYSTVSVDWPNRDKDTGQHQWYVKVEPVAGESKLSDNVANHTAFIYNPQPAADLSLTMSVDNSTPVEILDKFTYTINVTNPNPTQPATDLLVEDILPPELNLISYTASQGVYFTSGPWNVGNLAPGATATLKIKVQVDFGQAENPIQNTAEIISSGSLDANSSNNKKSVTITPIVSKKLYLPLVLSQ